MTAIVPPPTRNPGPTWGYRFLRGCDQILPEWLFKPLRALGTWIALAAMPAQRRYSRAYLQLALSRRPHLLDTFRHFFSFEESLMLKLRVANGRHQRTATAPGSEHFHAFLKSGEAGFLGTFHFGHSDLLGFLLGPVENHRVFMVRQRVNNSHDTEELGKRFGQWLTFIWVNDPENLLFAMKEAVASGGSIAMKCDRLEFSAKTEAFEFLGARRLFPFTIYHLAIIFKKPVLFSVGVPENDVSILYGAPRWDADPARSRAENLASAQAHFQNFLRLIEALIRKNPYLWFNFIELNPVALANGSAERTTRNMARLASSR